MRSESVRSLPPRVVDEFPKLWDDDRTVDSVDRLNLVRVVLLGDVPGQVMAPAGSRVLEHTTIRPAENRRWGRWAVCLGVEPC